MPSVRKKLHAQGLKSLPTLWDGTTAGHVLRLRNQTFALGDVPAIWLFHRKETDDRSAFQPSSLSEVCYRAVFAFI
jgi:hypothetical protein